MRFRPLGRTGIQVSEIGIGTWELSGDVWGAKDDEVSLAAVRAGLDAGANFIDTAADYGQGHVESLIGRVLAARVVARDDLVIATKVRPANMVWAPPVGVGIGEAFPPVWIRSECEASLRRLRTDHVDVLYLHTWSRAWGAEDEWFSAMSDLKAAGKVRAIGISVPDEGATDANVAIVQGQVEVIQCVYSVFQQEPETSLFPLASRHGVGIVARSAFSSGALVQDWSALAAFAAGDWRASWPAEKVADWREEQVRMSAAVGALVGESGLDRPAFCLQFVLGAPEVSSVIPGSANPDHMRDNASAGSRAPVLGPAMRARAQELWRTGAVHGTYAGSG